MKYLFVLMLVISGYAVQAQIQPVNWQFVAKKTADKVYEIHFTPTVKSPWHIYSLTSPEGAGMPTKFSFGKNPVIKIEGKVKEFGTIVNKYEEVFDVTTKYFKGKADFVVVVKLKSNVKTNLTGKVEWMACTDEECLPLDTKSFSIPLN